MRCTLLIMNLSSAELFKVNFNANHHDSIHHQHCLKNSSEIKKKFENFPTRVQLSKHFDLLHLKFLFLFIFFGKRLRNCHQQNQTDARQLKKFSQVVVTFSRSNFNNFETFCKFIRQKHFTWFKLNS